LRVERGDEIMNRLDEIKYLLPVNVRERIFNENTTYPYQRLQFEKLQEIRLRVGQPLIMQYDNKEMLYQDMIVTREDISQCMQYVSEYSIYAYQEDIRQGFITVRGGHRIGLIGKAVFENGNIKSQKFISFINIRVAHQVLGCADSVMEFVTKDGKLSHTLIISPPGCGKTTLLRDIIRQLSFGTTQKPHKICVVDERSEIAACFEGVPQNDVGPRTDVLDCCFKATGMLMLIRSMSPDIIAIDEIGGSADIDAIKYIINCGCTVIGTVHGFSCEDILHKPDLQSLIKKNIFSRLIVLSANHGVGTIEELIEL
jgi:stage III sporulation protein AA